MGKFHVGRHDKEMPQPRAADVWQAPVQMQPEIVYVDRPVEIIREIPVEVIREVIVERIVEKEVPRLMIEYKNVEVPVIYEKEIIKEVPIYIEKEVIREVMPKVIDITNHLEMKRQIRKNKFLKSALVIALLLNLILLVK